MKIALIARSTLFSIPGGDTVQAEQTARHLRQLQVDADICLSGNEINYKQYDLFHFFNLTRPADILYHTKRIKAPYVISPILVDYSEYDKQHRKGLSGFIFRALSTGSGEYLKTVLRAVKGNDTLKSKKYLWLGHTRSIHAAIKGAAILLPNSESEYRAFEKRYGTATPYLVVPNGVDESLFQLPPATEKDDNLVICAARIEGIKNQLNLIKAINGTRYQLLIIGQPAINQQPYYNQCKKAAASNVQFLERISQEKLARYYASAKVHVLPSWFETCGLSSLEAAAMGCNVVITEKGFTRDYFQEEAYYCDPGSPESILMAIDKASQQETNKRLQEKILHEFTWQRAAQKTLAAYTKVLTGK